MRLTEPDHLAEIDSLFELSMSDDTASWWLDETGNWTRHSTAEDGTLLNDMQDVLMKKTSQRKRSVR